MLSITALTTRVSILSGCIITRVLRYILVILVKAHAKAVKAFRDMDMEGEIAFKNDGFVYVQTLF